MKEITSITLIAWGSVRCSLIPAGVDGHHEHGNNMLSTGRKATKLSRELAAADPGGLGAAGSKGVLYRVHRNPIPVTDTPAGPHLKRDAPQVTEEIAGLLAIEEVRPGPGSFISQTIPGGKKGWGIQTSGEPERVEPICWDRALQDGRAPSSPFPNATRDWVAKLDLKDAYLQVAIHPSYHKFLQFQW